MSVHAYTIIYLYLYMCNDVDDYAVMLYLHMCNFSWYVHNFHTFSDVVDLLGLVTCDSQGIDTHKVPLRETMLYTLQVFVFLLKMT